MDNVGNPVRQRHRHYYESKALATADIPRVREQHEETGSGDFILKRKAANEYEEAKVIAGTSSLVDVAKFWRQHDSLRPKAKLGELLAFHRQSWARHYPSTSGLGNRTSTLRFH